MSRSAHRGVLRPAALASAAACLALVAAPTASGKVWFDRMEGREVHIGQRVTTTIRNCPGNDSCASFVRGIAVRLRRGAARNVSRVPTTALGRVGRDGRLRFRVPVTTPGRYHLIAVVPYRGGQRRLLASGTFRILPARG